MKKKILIILGSLLALFAVVNLLWFGWSRIKYSAYTKDLSKIESPSVIVPRYAANDADDFDYSVKYPDYLSLTGNLAVGFPSSADNPFSDGLIIWPKVFGGYEYGVILNPREDDPEGYMFDIDAQGNAIQEEYQEVAERYSDVISELLSRANAYWDLG